MNDSQPISLDPDYLMGDIPFGVCLLDGDFEILDANETWLEITSAEKSDIIGKKLSEVFPEIKKNLTSFLTEIASRRKPFHCHEFPISFGKDALAVIRNYNFIYYPVFNSKDEPEHFCSIAIEIPDMIGLQDKLSKSEERLRLATESNNISTWDLDLNNFQIHHSFALSKIFGYPEAHSITHLEMRNHIISEDQPLLDAALKKAKNDGIYSFEGRIKDANGEIKWINSQGKVFFTDDKKAVRMVGVLQDISERKDLEKEIEEREVRYKFLADAMPQFIWISDPVGHLNYFNQSVFDFSGKTYEDFMSGDGWLQIVHPDDREKNIESWTHCIKNKTVFTFEHRFQNKNGDFKWMLSRAVPDFDEYGNVKHWVGTSTDIDEIKKQEYQKNDFIKMANHELKTPITTIKGYVQLLKKMRGNSDDQFLNNSLNTIDNQVNKLNNLIGDLLDISRMENGNLPLVRRPFSLIKLVTETIEDIKASEDSHEIKFILNCDDDVEVNADKERITQVLNNLLTNAIKYAPNSKIVNVELSVDKNQAIVSVEDFGIGMNPEELLRIFERFYRVSGEDEETFPGFGIGLFIVKDILNRHNGNIWAQSEKQKGSKFYFSLPLNQKK
ncbi:MAG: PAS domain-containing protein [Chryseobacterium sp.]|nr:PAS domain-containing protein [Chryseobacterium sp.]